MQNQIFCDRFYKYFFILNKKTMILDIYKYLLLFNILFLIKSSDKFKSYFKNVKNVDYELFIKILEMIYK
jgi:hypothetical protein